MVSRWTREEHDELQTAMERLEEALPDVTAGSAREWAQRADVELAAVDDALRCHVCSSEGPDGLFAEIDQARPTLARRVEKLRDDHCRLLVQSGGLRSMVRAHAVSASEMRRLVNQFLEALREHQKDEMAAVFESFNLDLGAGD
jgi:hypothetical protein